MNNNEISKLYQVLAQVYGGENPLYKEAENRLIDFQQRINSIPAIGNSPNLNFIEFPKQYSSNTPIMDSFGKKVVGGGYFLVINGKGCVIDPGHHFIQNFFSLPRSINDICAIFVTHFHDDHYADLAALLSLLYRRSKIDKDISIDIFLDNTTYTMFKPILRSADYFSYGHNPVRIDKKYHLKNDEDIIIECLPTCHNVFGKTNSGVGYHFYREEDDFSLIITGDTAWTDEINKFYYNKFHNSKSYKVLIAHVSCIFKDEGAFVGAFNSHLKPNWHPNHLAIGGLCKCIEACKPDRLIISEIGEELEGIIDKIAEIISQTYNIENVSIARFGKRIILNKAHKK